MHFFLVFFYLFSIFISKVYSKIGPIYCIDTLTGPNITPFFTESNDTGYWDGINAISIRMNDLILIFEGNILLTSNIYPYNISSSYGLHNDSIKSSYSSINWVMNEDDIPVPLYTHGVPTSILCLNEMLYIFMTPSVGNAGGEGAFLIKASFSPLYPYLYIDPSYSLSFSYMRTIATLHYYDEIYLYYIRSNSDDGIFLARVAPDHIENIASYSFFCYSTWSSSEGCATAIIRGRFSSLSVYSSSSLSLIYIIAKNDFALMLYSSSLLFASFKTEILIDNTPMDWYHPGWGIPSHGHFIEEQTIDEYASRFFIMTTLLKPYRLSVYVDFNVQDGLASGDIQFGVIIAIVAGVLIVFYGIYYKYFRLPSGYESIESIKIDSLASKA